MMGNLWLISRQIRQKTRPAMALKKVEQNVRNPVLESLCGCRNVLTVQSFRRGYCNLLHALFVLHRVHRNGAKFDDSASKSHENQ